jgi:hypothetical protein
MRNSQSEKFEELIVAALKANPHLAGVVADEDGEQKERDVALADILRMVADVLEYGPEAHYD